MSTQTVQLDWRAGRRRRAKERLRHKRTVIQARISQAGYYV